eukprot:TRINITY_DN17230_c0_g2_i1.p1 TRINITY_DN17230_c0_g2~~TRINITY_DN17230_c0_g2_i1.p1  ORF type:complete len:1505 (+),score=299.97 TRINITY_DN17230_c0_g2_i1:64-4578(+)
MVAPVGSPASQRRNSEDLRHALPFAAPLTAAKRHSGSNIAGTSGRGVRRGSGQAGGASGAVVNSRRPSRQLGVCDTPLATPRRHAAADTPTSSPRVKRDGSGCLAAWADASPEAAQSSSAFEAIMSAASPASAIGQEAFDGLSFGGVARASHRRSTEVRSSPSSKKDEDVDRIRVAVRVRPALHKPAGVFDCVLAAPCVGHVSFSMKSNREFAPSDEEAPRHFAFDAVFDTTASQADVFEGTGAAIVENALEGFNGCLLAYGQTGSGKTYTLYGGSQAAHSCGCGDSAGTIPRFVRMLFQRASEGGMKLEVAASFLEIYNERLKDLFAAALPATSSSEVLAGRRRSSDVEVEDALLSAFRGRRPSTQALGKAEDKAGLQLLQHPKQGVYVKGLSEVTVTGEDSLQRLVDIAGRQRAVGETKLNSQSSRSHAVLRLQIDRQGGDDGPLRAAASSEAVTDEKPCPDEGAELGGGPAERMAEGPTEKDASPSCLDGMKRSAVVYLVDLAGSERSKKAETSGARRIEGVHINMSLMALGQVISALSDKKLRHHAPFRQSRLTHLLQESLCGNSRTCLLATVSPLALDAHETLSTLRFAASAKKVKTHPTANLASVEQLTLSMLLEKFPAPPPPTNVMPQPLLGFGGQSQQRSSTPGWGEQASPSRSHSRDQAWASESAEKTRSGLERDDGEALQRMWSLADVGSVGSIQQTGSEAEGRHRTGSQASSPAASPRYLRSRSPSRYRPRPGSSGRHEASSRGKAAGSAGAPARSEGAAAEEEVWDLERARGELINIRRAHRAVVRAQRTEAIATASAAKQTDDDEAAPAAGRKLADSTERLKEPVRRFPSWVETQVGSTASGTGAGTAAESHNSEATSPGGPESPSMQGGGQSEVEVVHSVVVPRLPDSFMGKASDAQSAKEEVSTPTLTPRPPLPKSMRPTAEGTRRKPPRSRMELCLSEDEQSLPEGSRDRLVQTPQRDSSLCPASPAGSCGSWPQSPSPRTPRSPPSLGPWALPSRPTTASLPGSEGPSSQSSPQRPGEGAGAGSDVELRPQIIVSNRDGVVIVEEVMMPATASTEATEEARRAESSQETQSPQTEAGDPTAPPSADLLLAAEPLGPSHVEPADREVGTPPRGTLASGMGEDPLSPGEHFRRHAAQLCESPPPSRAAAPSNAGSSTTSRWPEISDGVEAAVVAERQRQRAREAWRAARAAKSSPRGEGGNVVEKVSLLESQLAEVTKRTGSSPSPGRSLSPRTAVGAASVFHVPASPVAMQSPAAAGGSFTQPSPRTSYAGPPARQAVDPASPCASPRQASKTGVRSVVPALLSPRQPRTAMPSTPLSARQATTPASPRIIARFRSEVTPVGMSKTAGPPSVAVARFRSDGVAVQAQQMSAALPSFTPVARLKGGEVRPLTPPGTPRLQAGDGRTVLVAETVVASRQSPQRITVLSSSRGPGVQSSSTHADSVAPGVPRHTSLRQATVLGTGRQPLPAMERVRPRLPGRHLGSAAGAP